MAERCVAERVKAVGVNAKIVWGSRLMSATAANIDFIAIVERSYWEVI